MKLSKKDQKILAKTQGRGMSFTSNFLLMKCLRKGKKMVICDVGGSYKKLCEIFSNQKVRSTFLKNKG